MTRIQHIQKKLVTISEAVQRVSTWKLKNDKVVFTNGCFDILHKGHVTYLAKAADLGSRLIVGINTDTSVKRLGKGDDRPINNEEARALLLSALGFIDLVVLFDNDTQLELIQQIQPDILVKGSDYDPNETNLLSKKYIVGSDIVKNYGGKVAVISLVEGYSTSNIIQKIKK